MAVTALVMAGGKANRMKSSTEKALLEVCGKTMLQRVTHALRQSKSVTRVVVAVTASTPLTARKARDLSLEVLETPGHGYESDMQYAIKKLDLGEVLVVSADIPLITFEIVDQAIRQFKSSGKPALAVMSPLKLYDQLGLHPQYIFEVNGIRMVPVGINLVDGRKMDRGDLDQEILVSESEAIALNVNTPRELELARLRCDE